MMLAIVGIVIFIISKNFNQLPIKKENPSSASPSENQTIKDDAVLQRINKANSQIDSLISDLHENILKLEPTDTSLILAAIKDYETDFNNYTAIVNQLNYEMVDKNLLSSLRLAEWENYRIYLNAKERFADNDVALQTITISQKMLDEYIKNQTVKALSPLIIESYEKSGIFLPSFADKIVKILLNTAVAKEQGNVIHKKVIIDPDDPGRHAKGKTCWSYESWIDLDSGNVKQEQKLNIESGDKIPILTGECKTEINITEESTGRILGLNVTNKTFEWITDPAMAIGAESTLDPYSNFKDMIENGEYILTGTDTFENHEVYLMQWNFYQNEYEIVYIDAVSYLPIRKLTYYEDTIRETVPPYRLIKNGQLYIAYGDRYVAAEIIKRDALPLDFFELKIPDDYELRKPRVPAPGPRG